MNSVFAQHAHILQSLFDEYADAGSGPQDRRLGLNQFLNLAVKYNITPALLSRIDTIKLFRSCITSLKAIAQHDTLSYKDFLNCLARCAYTLFSGPEWNRQFPHPRHKVQLLFFWMDQASKLFKGNSKELIMQAGIPYNQPHVFESLPHVASVDSELSLLYNRYCAYSNRLNVGKQATMPRTSFMKFVKDCGLIGPELTPSEVDLVFEKVVAAAKQHETQGQWNSTNFTRRPKVTSTVHQRMNYDLFYYALAEIAVRMQGCNPNGPITSRGVALHALLGQFIMPMAARFVQDSNKHDHTGHSGPALDAKHADSNDWRVRYHRLKAVEEELQSAEVAASFGVSLEPQPQKYGDQYVQQDYSAEGDDVRRKLQRWRQGRQQQREQPPPQPPLPTKPSQPPQPLSSQLSVQEMQQQLHGFDQEYKERQQQQQQQQQHDSYDGDGSYDEEGSQDTPFSYNTEPIMGRAPASKFEALQEVNSMIAHELGSIRCFGTALLESEGVESQVESQALPQAALPHAPRSPLRESRHHTNSSNRGSRDRGSGRATAKKSENDDDNMAFASMLRQVASSEGRGVAPRGAKEQDLSRGVDVSAGSEKSDESTGEDVEQRMGNLLQRLHERVSTHEELEYEQQQQEEELTLQQQEQREEQHTGVYRVRGAVKLGTGAPLPQHRTRTPTRSKSKSGTSVNSTSRIQRKAGQPLYRITASSPEKRPTAPTPEPHQHPLLPGHSRYQHQINRAASVEEIEADFERANGIERRPAEWEAQDERQQMGQWGPGGRIGTEGSGTGTAYATKVLSVDSSYERNGAGMSTPYSLSQIVQEQQQQQLQQQLEQPLPYRQPYGHFSSNRTVTVTTTTPGRKSLSRSRSPKPKSRMDMYYGALPLENQRNVGRAGKAVVANKTDGGSNAKMTTPSRSSVNRSANRSVNRSVTPTRGRCTSEALLSSSRRGEYSTRDDRQSEEEKMAATFAAVAQAAAEGYKQKLLQVQRETDERMHTRISALETMITSHFGQQPPQQQQVQLPPQQKQVQLPPPPQVQLPQQHQHQHQSPQPRPVQQIPEFQQFPSQATEQSPTSQPQTALASNSGRTKGSLANFGPNGPSILSLPLAARPAMPPSAPHTSTPPQPAGARARGEEKIASRWAGGGGAVATVSTRVEDAEVGEGLGEVAGKESDESTRGEVEASLLIVQKDAVAPGIERADVLVSTPAPVPVPVKPTQSSSGSFITKCKSLPSVLCVHTNPCTAPGGTSASCKILFEQDVHASCVRMHGVSAGKGTNEEEISAQISLRVMVTVSESLVPLL
jgi:hypothetical protein